MDSHRKNERRKHPKLAGLLKWALFPLFDTVNQICMKTVGLSLGDKSFDLAWLQFVLISPYLWIAIAADIGSFFMWMLILKKSDLSFAAPFISMQYITILIASFVFFHESIDLIHLVGILIIISGLILIGTEETKITK